MKKIVIGFFIAVLAVLVVPSFFNDNNVGGGPGTINTLASKTLINGTAVRNPDLTNTETINWFVNGSEVMANVADESIDSNYLADDAVLTTNINNLAVTTGKVADDAITFAKMQNITSDRILGRETAGSGNIEELTLQSPYFSLDSGELKLNSSPTQGGSFHLDAVAASTKTYYSFYGGQTTDATIRSSRLGVIGFSGRIQEVYVRLNTGQPASGNLVLALDVNTAETSLITIAAGSAAGVYSATGLALAVAKGDEVAWIATNNATANSGAINNFAWNGIMNPN